MRKDDSNVDEIILFIVGSEVQVQFSNQAHQVFTGDLLVI